jgi:hypothetical protein
MYKMTLQIDRNTSRTISTVPQPVKRKQQSTNISSTTNLRYQPAF